MLNVGVIEFINTLPLFLFWDQSSPDFNHTILRGSPQVLNQALGKNELDISLVSSAFFLDNQDQYCLANNWGIAANGPVLSVLLFSRYCPQDLDKKKVQLAYSSKSSNNLFHVLSRHFWNIEPELYQASVPFNYEDIHNWDACVIIGDEALEVTPPPGYKSYDLAQLWKQETSLPFVFGVLCAQKCAYQNKANELEAFFKRLESSFNLGLQNMPQVLEKAKHVVSISEILLERYYQVLYYKLGSDEIKALQLFDKLMHMYPLKALQCKEMKCLQ